jgi:hypothetical protein
MGKDELKALRGYYEYILNDLDKNLVQGKYKVYIHDTLEKLEAGMAAWAESNITRFGFTSVSSARKYGKIWSAVIYPLYEQIVSAIFSRGVEVIIFCSHLRTPWEGNKPVPGKVEPSGKKLLHRLSSLMLWLTNDPSNEDGAPAGLVLKERLGNLDVVDGKWKPRRMLPKRIPHCTWEDVKDYLEEGCNLSDPAPGEVMSQDERRMTSRFLSDEQIALMVADAETERLQKQIEANQWRQMSSPSVDVAAMLGGKTDPALVVKARELGLTVETKSHVRNLMIDDVPLPLRESMVDKIDRAIEEVLSG